MVGQRGRRGPPVRTRGVLRAEYAGGRRVPAADPMKRPSLPPRMLATGLLVAVSVLFAVARSLEARVGWMEWVRAFAEAAMIGALADWFAVVALFRHPLGIRIPHTAILPRRQAEMGVTLGRFVEENFLTRPVLEPWVERMDFAANAAFFLRERAGGIAARVAALLPRVLAAVDETRMASVVFGQVREMLRRLPVAPALGEVLELLTRDGMHESVLNHVLRLGAEVVVQHREKIRREVYLEIPLPDWPLVEPVRASIADYVAERTVERVCKNLTAVAQDPAHELRRQFRSWLQGEVVKLRQSPHYFAKGEEIKMRLLNDPAVARYVERLWGGIREMLIEDLGSGDSRVQAVLGEFLKGVGERMEADADLCAGLNASLRSHLLDGVERHREAVGSLISTTVRGWDVRHLVQKVEDAVGDDLQYIRVSGTVVGGTAGLLLHLVQKLVWS